MTTMRSDERMAEGLPRLRASLLELQRVAAAVSIAATRAQAGQANDGRGALGVNGAQNAAPLRAGTLRSPRAQRQGPLTYAQFLADALKTARELSAQTAQLSVPPHPGGADVRKAADDLRTDIRELKKDIARLARQLNMVPRLIALRPPRKKAEDEGEKDKADWDNSDWKQAQKDQNKYNLISQAAEIAVGVAHQKAGIAIDEGIEALAVAAMKLLSVGPALSTLAAVELNAAAAKFVVGAQPSVTIAEKLLWAVNTTELASEKIEAKLEGVEGTVIKTLKAAKKVVSDGKKLQDVAKALQTAAGAASDALKAQELNAAKKATKQDEKEHVALAAAEGNWADALWKVAKA